MSDYKIEVLSYPLEEDWIRCKMLALNTMGKRYVQGSGISEVWKKQILMAEHSPIRTLRFVIKMEVPYFVSNHFVRHKVGVEHYVQSQRNDRQDKYDRNEAKQSELVSHIMELDAQALINMARMRLCLKADVTTRKVMREVVRQVLLTNGEFIGLLVERCKYLGFCPEMTPCYEEGKKQK